MKNIKDEIEKILMSLIMAELDNEADDYFPVASKKILALFNKYAKEARIDEHHWLAKNAMTVRETRGVRESFYYPEASQLRIKELEQE